MFWIWLGIVVLLAIVEAMTINLTTIWFVISGLVSLFVSFTSDDFGLQLGIFALGGFALLILTRPLLLRFLPLKKEKTNADRIIGMTGIVTEAISKNHPGEVKVDGKRWTAIEDFSIEIDSDVKILSIDGVKLKVEKGE